MLARDSLLDTKNQWTTVHLFDASLCYNMLTLLNRMLNCNATALPSWLGVLMPSLHNQTSTICSRGLRKGTHVSTPGLHFLFVSVFPTTVTVIIALVASIAIINIVGICL